MALGDMKRDDMAELLGRDPATLSRWMGDKGTPPARAFILQWALATNVSAEWLETGVEPSNGPHGGQTSEPYLSAVA
jgi:transcriptional regulator with XRE-family HTH domain